MIWIFLILFTIQMLFANAYRYRKSKIETQAELGFPPVSILICGKNESVNFKRFLPEVLAQMYNENVWEVVVVNDASTDDSAKVLAVIAAQNPRVKIVEIDTATERHFPGKKFALQQGLKACKHEVVLLTDADCYPHSKNWLQGMARIYAVKRSTFAVSGLFVLGYGAYKKETGLLNRFVRWETGHTFMQYASWAKMGHPYMGVGRNLMYEKSPVLALLEDEQFAQHFSKIPSGDDDLIVSALANIQNTVIADAPETHTQSIAHDNWSKWWRQKTRHVSSGKYYASLVKNGLALYALSSFLFWIVAVLLLVNTQGINQMLVLFLMLIRTLAFWANAFKWSSVLDQPKTAWFYPIGEWMWLCYNFAIAPFIFWKNKQQWK